MSPEQKQLIREKFERYLAMCFMRTLSEHQKKALFELLDESIDLAIKQTEERIVEKIQEMPNANINEVQNEKVISAEVIITLIRNK